MDRFLGPAVQWWEGRTVRERRMLAVMLAILVGVAAWLAVVRPAWAWREAAAARRERAVATATEARRDLARLAPRGLDRPAPAEGLEPLVRRTAAAAGLDAVLAMDAGGGLGFRLASVSSGAGLTWLAALEADHGVRLCRLGVIENADATVAIEGGLAAGPCAAAEAGGT